MICDSASIDYIRAGDFYLVKTNDKLIKLFPTNSSGIVAISEQTILEKNHSQIIFHDINNNVICEIKPFVLTEDSCYNIKNANIKLTQTKDKVFIYFNNIYYGALSIYNTNIKFKKITINDTECGILNIESDNKFVIIFTYNHVVYCGRYVDYEIVGNSIKVYSHNPNMFNIGSLLEYDFKTNNLNVKSILDNEIEYKQTGKDFEIIYFIEAVKCKRFKYAYNKLSYELKNSINVDTLSKYFPTFNSYYYLNNMDVYILLNNKKIVGVYHFEIKDNKIYNIH